MSGGRGGWIWGMGYRWLSGQHDASHLEHQVGSALRADLAELASITIQLTAVGVDTANMVPDEYGLSAAAWSLNSTGP